MGCCCNISKAWVIDANIFLQFVEAKLLSHEVCEFSLFLLHYARAFVYSVKLNDRYQCFAYIEVDSLLVKCQVSVSVLGQFPREFYRC